MSLHRRPGFSPPLPAASSDTSSVGTVPFRMGLSSSAGVYITTCPKGKGSC